MKRWSGLVASSIGILLGACGGGGGGGDRGPGGAPGANQPPGFSVNQATSFPANNATKVALDKAIIVQFTEAVDPSSVTTANVQVLPVMMDMGDMAGMMRWEDSTSELTTQVAGNVTANGNTVTFTPTEHFENGVSYRVVINNIRNRARTATLPPTELKFSTLRNPTTQRIEYSEVNPGVIESRHVYEIDPMTGMMRTMTSYDAANLVRSHEVMMPAQLPGPPPVEVMSVTHSDAAGTLIRDYEAEVATEGSVIFHGEYVGPGADNIWNKTDDLLEDFTATGPIAPGSSNWLSKRYSATAAPAPWSARTTAFVWRSSEYTQRDAATGRTIRQVSYGSATPDGLGGLGPNGIIDLSPTGDPAPVDDRVTQYRTTKRDLQGRRTEIREFGDRGRDGAVSVDPRGPDGIIFTADDVITELTTYTYDAMGHEILEVEYDGPGLDSNWDTTADNTVESYEVSNYTAAGIRDWEKEYEDGGDGILQSGDDILVEERRFDTAL